MLKSLNNVVCRAGVSNLIQNQPKGLFCFQKSRSNIWWYIECQDWNDWNENLHQHWFFVYMFGHHCFRETSGLASWDCEWYYIKKLMRGTFFMPKRCIHYLDYAEGMHWTIRVMLPFMLIMLAFLWLFLIKNNKTTLDVGHAHIRFKSVCKYGCLKHWHCMILLLYIGHFF